MRKNRCLASEGASIHSFPDDFDQDPFSPPPVELPVENLLPRTEIEFSIGHGHHNLSSHDQPFQVGIAILFTHIVTILSDDTEKQADGEQVSPARHQSPDEARIRHH